MTYIVTTSSTLENSPYIIYEIGRNILKEEIEFTVHVPRSRRGSYSFDTALFPIRVDNWQTRTVFSEDGVSSNFIDYVNGLHVYFDLNPATEEIEIGQLVLGGDFYFETGAEAQPESKNVAWDSFHQPANKIAHLDTILIRAWNGPGYFSDQMRSTLSNGMLASYSILFSQNVDTSIDMGDLINAFSDADTSKTLISTLDKFLNPEPAKDIANGANSEPAKDITKGANIDIITGTSKRERLKGKKTSVHLRGMGGNDKLTGSRKDDILDGGDGNDVLTGKKGADVYVLSSGNDKFKGFKLKEGDTIQIDSDIAYSLMQSKKHTLIQHDDGVTKVFKVNTDDLTSVIELVT